MANNIVKLNVGGLFYTTTRSTMCTYPDSMFNGTMDSTKDENGCYFIDRDGELFKYILNFLRSSELAAPKDITAMKQLRLEASFYQIMPLVKIIDDLLVPKQLEYIVIKQINSAKKNAKSKQMPNKITIRGTDDLITKYFGHLGKIIATQTDTTYATLMFYVGKSHGSMSYGKALCQDGWTLASTTSVAMASQGDYGQCSTIVNKDTWKLEK